MKKIVAVCLVLSLTLGALNLPAFIKAETYTSFDWTLTSRLTVYKEDVLNLTNGVITFDLIDDKVGIKNYGTLILDNVTIKSVEGKTWKFENVGTFIADGKNFAEISGCPFFITRYGRLNVRNYFFDEVGFSVNHCPYSRLTNNTFKIKGPTFVKSQNIYVSNNTVLGDWILYAKPNFRFYGCNNTQVEWNRLFNGYDNGIRIGSCHNFYGNNNYIEGAWHEAVWFGKSHNITLEKTVIRNGGTGIEAGDLSSNFLVIDSDIEVGRKQWGSALEAEYASHGKWVGNKARCVNFDSKCGFIFISSNSTNIEFVDNSGGETFPVGFKCRPKSGNDQEDSLGGFNIVVKNSSLPTVLVVKSGNVTFINCNVTSEPVIEDSFNVTFITEEPENPEPENPEPSPPSTPVVELFKVESNATILNIRFLVNESNLAFETKNISSSMVITVSKGLLPEISDLKLYVNGELAVYMVEENGEFWIIKTE